MKPLPQNYNHKEAEKRWQQTWFSGDVYHWDEAASRAESFVIDTPPPTVSGLLHMGHIFSYTQADFVARYQRMKGKTVFYPMGFDDNGLPTERLVEKVKKIRATDMSREDFIQQCESVAEEARVEFRHLFQSVALSVDWRQEYSTISEESRRISQLSFLDLISKDRAYRKLQPMLWDPVDQTAIAQAEIEDKELPSFANIIPFGIVDALANPSEIKWAEIRKVEVMTTRPELLAACVALMCHPDDAAQFAGKSAITPIFGVKVPIIADEKVNKEKGTGFVMCCTFGDETDIHWWKTHNLDTRIILNKYGKLELNVAWLKPEPDRAYCSVMDEKWSALQGLKVSAARDKTIEILKETNCLLKQDPITHAVKCAERSGAPLEILPTHQWFVKILDIKQQLKQKSDECNWYPDFMRIRIHQWIDGLSWDWCISRQRYFGVPFPVWYVRRDNGTELFTVVAKPAQLPVNPLRDLPDGFIPISGPGGRQHPTDDKARLCVLEKDITTVEGVVLKGDGHAHYKVIAEADVMDTWATSSVSPQLSSKAINKEFAVDFARHQKLFPADLRPQAHEIIRTWAFYTIVKAYLHEQSIPWKNLMISGWCLASDKTKMSKSKGNVVTPVALIEEKGADAVRYWASTSRLGADTAFSEDVLTIGKKLVNKLWNATKFASLQFDKLAHTPTTAAEDVKAGKIHHPVDQWILSRLRRAIDKADREFAVFEYCDARVAIEEFFWKDFCDNYLEIIKKRAYREGDDASISEADQQSAILTVYHCLEALLRLFAPFVPHITEELYQHIFDEKAAKHGSIHGRGRWPVAAEYPLAESAEATGIALVQVLDAVRRLKAERNVSIKWPLDVLQISASPEHQAILKPGFSDLANVTNAKAVEFSSGTLSTQSEDQRFSIAATFAAESDAA